MNIDSTCRVGGYASGKTVESFLQAIDKGMYEMDKRDRMGLSQDDDKRLGFYLEMKTKMMLALWWS